MTSRRKWHNVFCFRSWLGWKQVHQQLVSSRGLCVTVREPGLCLLLSQIRRSHWHLSLDWESVAWSRVASWLTVRHCTATTDQPGTAEATRGRSPLSLSWGGGGLPSPKLEWSAVKLPDTDTPPILRSLSSSVVKYMSWPNWECSLSEICILLIWSNNFLTIQHMEMEMGRRCWRWHKYFIITIWRRNWCQSLAAIESIDSN